MSNDNHTIDCFPLIQIKRKNFKIAEFIITRTQYSTKIILMFTNSKILKIKKVKCATDHWRPRSMPIEK